VCVFMTTHLRPSSRCCRLQFISVLEIASETRLKIENEVPRVLFKIIILSMDCKIVGMEISLQRAVRGELTIFAMLVKEK
jgi:hypothetical protein